MKRILSVALALAITVGALRAAPTDEPEQVRPPKPFELFSSSATAPWTVKKAAAEGRLGEILAGLKVSPKDREEVQKRIRASMCQEKSKVNCAEPAELGAEAERWALGVYPDLLVVRAWTTMTRVTFTAFFERRNKSWKLKNLFEDDGHYGEGWYFPVLLGGRRYLASETGSGGTNLMVRRLSFFDIDAPVDAAALRLLTYEGTFNLPNGFEWRVKRINGSGTGPWNLAVTASLSYDGVHNAGGPIYVKQFNFEAPTTGVSSKAGPDDVWPAYMPEPLKVYLGAKGMHLPLLSGDAFMLGARIKNGDKDIARWVHYLLRGLDEDERKDKNVVELQKLVEALPEAKEWTKELKKEEEESR